MPEAATVLKMIDRDELVGVSLRGGSADALPVLNLLEMCGAHAVLPLLFGRLQAYAARPEDAPDPYVAFFMLRRFLQSGPDCQITDPTEVQVSAWLQWGVANRHLTPDGTSPTR